MAHSIIVLYLMEIKEATNIFLPSQVTKSSKNNVFVQITEKQQFSSKTTFQYLHSWIQYNFENFKVVFVLISLSTSSILTSDSTA